MYICSFISIILAMCSYNSTVRTEVQKVNQVINQHALKEQSNSGIVLMGSGLSYPDKIHSIHVHYRSTDKLKLNQVRKLFIEGVDRLLTLVNDDRELESYLISYPFSPTNVEYIIAFRNQDGSYVSSPDVAFVTNIGGIIHYDSRDPISGELYNIHQETFEEAKKILAKEERKND